MFVIYNTKDFYLWCGPNHYSTRYYATARAAKAQLTKLTKGPSAVLKEDEWAVASVDEFRMMEPEVEVKSVMGGTVKVRASERGNPALDPGMEGYWSM